MSISSVKDIVDAVDNGRVHTQMFLKTTTVAGDAQWQDWAYNSGFPAYNARVGAVGEATPMYGVRNSAIYFPEVNAGEDRRLLELVVRTGVSAASQASFDFVLYDLLMIYPLLDGDSTDQQFLVNDQSLPRYTSGDGVVAVLVNHVAPWLTLVNGSMVYTDSDGNEKTVALRVGNSGLNKVANIAGVGNFAGPFSIGMASGSKGVRSVTSIKFDSPPGGLYCLYLLKPLATISNNDGNLDVTKIATEKNFAQYNAFNLPKILDGAHLGFFLRPNGGPNRTNALIGHATFIWG